MSKNSRPLSEQVAYETADPEGCGYLNPEFVEYLMAWPTGWSDLQPLAKDKFQSWRRSHFQSCDGG